MPPDCVGEVIDVMPVHEPQRPLANAMAFAAVSCHEAADRGVAAALSGLTTAW
jgi:hypothetical protein